MSEVSKRRPTAEQGDAAERREIDVFCEAGAGTGKTGVLVERYCAAVASDGVGPEQILAFTFTEKAAAELRRRIRAELGHRARSADGEEATRLGDAVRSLGAAPITTIHGFCRRLLASHPIAAGLDPRFRVLDAAEARRVAWSAFEAALEDFVTAAGSEGERLLALYGAWRVRTLVLAAHAELVSRGDEAVLPAATPRDLDAALAEIETSAAAMTEAGKGNAEQVECVERARALAGGRAGRMPTSVELDALDTHKESSVAEVGACQRAIRTALAVSAEHGDGSGAYEALGRLLSAFARRYTEAKAERSALDFEDLQSGAVGLLGGNPELGASYRERFAHLLVDEFQDTNELQLALIEALRGPETRLFCVGDEFQAIYGFRHADIEVFRRQRAEFAARPGAEVIRLRGNFRSQPQILAAVNEVGNALMGRFEDLTAGRPPSGSPPTELLVTEPKGWDDHLEALDRPEGDRTPLDCLVEARALAQRLRRLVDEGRDPAEIVVLLRAFTQVEAFESALERCGLTPHVVGGGGYWSRLQAQDMVALLGTIANPLADEPLLGALASPAGGVAPDTLWTLRRAAGASRSLWSAVLVAAGESEAEIEEPAVLATLPGDERERLALFVSVIEGLRRSGTRLPLETLLARAVEETGYDLAILIGDHGRERYANVRKMMRLARDFEAVEGRDLRGFLDFATQSAEQDAEAPAAVSSEEGEGLRIMTVHSAKGLEFPVVAVAQLGRDLVRPGRAGDLVLGRAGERPLRAGLRLPRLGTGPLSLFDYADLADEALARDEAEELRLAYVAVTRAREQLILSGIRTQTGHSDLRSKSVLRRVLEHLDVEAPVGGEAIPIAPATPIGELGARPERETRIEIRVAAPGEEEATRLAGRGDPLAPDAPAALSPPPLVEHRTPSVAVSTLSYSALSEHARCGYRFYVERVLGVSAGVRNDPGEGERSRRRALGIGNAAHELLRRSAETRWAAPSSAGIEAALARQGIGAADTRARERLRTQLDGWLASELAATLRGGGIRMRAEHPFLLDLSETMVRGALDLIVERPNQAPLVLDYKTDRLNGDDPAARAERYATQRDVYAAAVSQGLEVHEVEVAYVFLEAPDEPVSTTLGPVELDAARASVTAAVAAVTGGVFDVTPTPDWPLCSDCPARRRLCPSPAPPPPRAGSQTAESAGVG